MPLTRKQIISLKSIRRYQDEPPELNRLLIKSLPYILKTSGLFGLGAYLMYQGGSAMAAVFVLGIIFGTWLIVFSNILTAIRIWPFLIRVIDWQKYDQLFEEESASKD